MAPPEKPLGGGAAGGAMGRWLNWRVGGSLGGSLRDADVGCLGAVLLVLFTAGSIYGLIVIGWWLVWKNSAGQP